MRDEYESDAIERIEDVAADFPAETDVETLVVFTPDRSTTIDRVADDYDAAVIVVPRDVRPVGRVLVPIRGDANIDRILAVVGTLLEESEATVTLFHAVPTGDEDISVGRTLLDGAVDHLVDAGVAADRVDTGIVESESPADDIIDAAAKHDVLVIGETDPSLIEHILGDVPTRVVQKVDRPVLVVRNTDPSDSD
ncbi:MAG: universal stress protein [Halobellus sp.]|uniref:universal stress protein n=1 Tax=Halobellus sp. TaxID=1979212 RepID=UPI0035D4A03D